MIKLLVELTEGCIASIHRTKSLPNTDCGPERNKSRCPKIIVPTPPLTLMLPQEYINALFDILFVDILQK